MAAVRDWARDVAGRGARRRDLVGEPGDGGRVPSRAHGCARSQAWISSAARAVPLGVEVGVLGRQAKPERARGVLEPGRETAEADPLLRQNSASSRALPEDVLAAAASRSASRRLQAARA